MSDKEPSRIERMLSKMDSIDQDEVGDLIVSVLDQVSEPPKRIPEVVFKEIFLPAFAGIDPGTEKKANEFISHWIGVVGSPTERAEIVDHVGNVIFTVPPIYNTDAINLTRSQERRTSFNGMLTDLSETSKISPALAMGEFAQAASERLDKTISDKNNSEIVQEWAGIFKRYGVIPGGTSVKAATAPEDGKMDDDFVF